MSDAEEDYGWGDPEDFTNYKVICARCGRAGTSAIFIAEEADEWECPECWEQLERKAPP